ncbi:hypothetical protein AB0N09_37165 [Streptomyces erythrochromogenes]|uniref:hypothetical protein n=1 Tax=Streptomyces erythrochromogenes TaxID=285574 RepID=UPI00342C4CD8
MGTNIPPRWCIDAMCLGSGADALVLGWSHHTHGVYADPLAVEIARVKPSSPT